MNGVTKMENNVVAANSSSIMEVISRAASDPQTDVDKLERLLLMYERINARDAKQAYDEALAQLQPRLPVISERGRILNRDKQIQSTYAYWEDVNEHIRPLLAEHGFALSFKTGRHGDLITVTGVLSHRAGHREETTMELPSDGSGSKNAVQAIASSTSYGKRYTAFALLNITTKGEDDDGVTATSRRADGEPMPRTKLDGKYPSKSRLQAALREFVHKLGQVATAEQIALLEAEYADALAQCQVDLPAWWNGDGGDKRGVNGQIADRYEAVGDGLFAGLINSMRECQTTTALARWMAANESAIDELGDLERRSFERERDAHESAIITLAKVTS